jgi:hypothetical protein
MTLTDWLTIIAMILGPLVAVQVTRYLDTRQEIRDRKLQIFKTLMATRGYAVSWEHVGALNRIDLEFQGENEGEKAVIDAWKAYLDHLHRKDLSLEIWGDKRVDLFSELLHKMSQVLGYKFDKTHIKNSSYSPTAHGNLDLELQVIRTQLIEMLDGKRPLPVSVSAPQTPPSPPVPFHTLPTFGK